jgi:predicted O-methyltransferase YrrM
MLRLLNGYLVARSIQFAAQLGIADALRDGPKAAAEIAAAVDAHPDALHRLLRALASVGLFTEVEPGSFALTPLGNCLREDAVPSLGHFARLLGSESYLRACDHFLEVVQTGQPGFELAHDISRYAYLDQHAELGTLYNRAMQDISSMQIPALLAAYDFSGIERIVDVGGGQGGLLTAILGANPHMTGILFERPPVAEEARAKFAAAGLADRCQVVGGDIAEEVPEGGDAYIVKHVFMELADAEALVVLRNVRRAMHGGSRLLVIDPVLPADNQPSPAAIGDLLMLLVSPGGRCRTPAEFHRLFETAGLVPGRVIPTPAGASIVEAVPGS